MSKTILSERGRRGPSGKLVAAGLSLVALLAGCESGEPAQPEAPRFSSIGTISVGGEAGLLLGAWVWDSEEREACLYVVQTGGGDSQTGVQCIPHPGKEDESDEGGTREE